MPSVSVLFDPRQRAMRLYIIYINMSASVFDSGPFEVIQKCDVF